MENFGKYEVIEKIGVGGFATVYKGFDPHIKRFVAIKTCSNEDDEMRRRFCQEAEIAGNLQHRNIVTVYDFGEQHGVPFLVQEYLTGEDLDRKIKRRDPLSYAERVLYLIQIARGLEYAHQKGVIHRDIKPANIRILEDGTARIMDFGIAKLAARQTELTQTGMTLGTAAYLSPEQIRGDPADHRTDIFSFGSLAYELFTYERPFAGEVIPNVLYRILNQQPKAIASFWPQCPAQVVRLVSRCIEKEPAQRYANCGALLADLDPILRILRAQPQVAPAEPGTGGHAADLMATSALRSGPTLQQERERATSAVETGATVRVQNVGDMALAHRSEAERLTPRSISTSAVYRRERRTWWPWLAGALALALLGAGAWRYFGRSHGAVPPRTTTVASPEVPPAAPAAAPTAAAATPNRAAAPTPATPAPAPLVPAAAAVPEPAPPPVKTAITVPASWSADMTVALDGGAARRLDRAQTIAVEPGNHVLSFNLVLPDYTDSDEIVVSLKPGQTRRVETPLRRPGRLTIQPALGSPVGMVKVDGESLGMSPVRNKILRAGVHRLEVLPASAEAGQAIAFEVSVQGDQAVVVTFNLQRPQEPPQVVARPLGSS